MTNSKSRLIVNRLIEEDETEDLIADIQFQGGRFDAAHADHCISLIRQTFRENAVNFIWSSFGENLRTNSSGETPVRTTVIIHFELADPRIVPTFREIEIMRTRLARHIVDAFDASNYANVRPVGPSAYEVKLVYVTI